MKSETYAEEIAELCGSYSAPSLSASSVGPLKRVSSRPVVRSWSILQRLLELAAVDAQIGLEQVGHGQARILVQLLGRLLFLLRAQVRAQRQRVRVGTHRKLFHILQKRLQFRRLLRQFFVVPGRGRVGPYAATAWYHKKLPQQPAELEPFLKDVEEFAMGPYTHALALGTDLSAEEKQQAAEKLHEYTGLPVAYLLKANLRVNGGEFEKTLQDDQDLTTGRLDTRFSGPTLDALSEGAEYDPQSSAISSAYVSLFNDYVRRELKYGEGQTYLAEALFSGSRWDFRHNGNPVSTNVAPDMAEAMKTNPRLKIMVNGGYYDLATPFFAAQYEDKHLPIPQSLAKNIEYDWYESGHMVYVREECLKQLHDRVAAFITRTQSENK